MTRRLQLIGFITAALWPAVIAVAQAPDCNGNGVPDDIDIAKGTSDDENGNGIPDECECPQDINGDGTIDVLDLLILLASWGACPEPCPPTCPSDLDGDCSVGVIDLLVWLAFHGGECPPG